MKYKMLPIVTAVDVEKLIYDQFREKINLRKLFWEDELVNNEYKDLFLDERIESEEEVQWYGAGRARQMNLVFSSLSEIFPFHSHILVDVSW